MGDSYSTQKLLALRKLTRSISDLLRGQMKDYLSTLAPLLRPKAVLGGYIQGSTNEMVKGAEKAFNDLQNLYESVATSKPFNLPKELKPPIDIISTAIDITAMEYNYSATTDGESKTVTITSPFKWVLNYSGFAPDRLAHLLKDRDKDTNDLQNFVLHYLVMNIVVTRQAGVSSILEALRFPICSDRLSEFGNLPITYISSSISTIRPPDDVIIENTEISGMNAFEEIVNIEDIGRMRDPLKERLIELAKEHEALWSQ